MSTREAKQPTAEHPITIESTEGRVLVRGNGQVVADTGGGVVFGNGDSRALAGALIDVLKDPGLRGELRERGLAGVKRYSWESLTPRIEELYRG